MHLGRKKLYKMASTPTGTNKIIPKYDKSLIAKDERKCSELCMNFQDYDNDY